MAHIQFINHASILVSDNKNGILTDPWYSGCIFNNGWRLLHETSEDEIKTILNQITHIWISHEHPDHFSPPFFLKYQKIIIDRKIKVLFQYTKDKRVINFLKSKNIEVIEIKDNSYYVINENFSVRVQNIDFYDSSLIIKIGDKTIINTNDCPFENQSELNNFAKKYGPADILLTQFSYAAWKGGRDNIEWRRKAALEKLFKIEKQAIALNCKKIIPFASFVYFSNSENKYLNSEMNSPSNLEEFFQNKDQEIVFMKPQEKCEIDKISTNRESSDFWREKIENVNLLPFFDYEKEISIEELSKKFEKYRDRVFKKNSYTLIKLISIFPFLKAFRDIKIRLYDNDIIINVSIFNGISLYDGNFYDVQMHSESFAFILDNEFGFDTLTVNGNFECQNTGFSKIAKLLSLGSLNAMGINVSINFIFRPDIYLLFIQKLFKAQKNILSE